MKTIIVYCNIPILSNTITFYLNEFQKNIELILEKLKEAGIDREKIEADLKYSNNYIDQALSRGGNKRLLNAIEGYARNILPNSINNSQDQETSLANKNSVEHELRGKWISEINVYALINTLLEEKDRALKKAEDDVLKWEARYQDKVKENSKLLDNISNLSKEKSGDESAAAHKDDILSAEKNSKKKKVARPLIA